MPGLREPFKREPRTWQHGQLKGTGGVLASRSLKLPSDPEREALFNDFPNKTKRYPC